MTSVLNSLSKVIKNKNLPIYDGQVGEYTPTLHRPSTPRKAREHNDRLLIMETFTHFFALGHSKQQLLGMDELSKSFLEFAKSKPVSVSLVFGSQILVDIHRILGERVEDAYSHLDSLALRPDTLLLTYVQPFPLFGQLRIRQWWRTSRLLSRNAFRATL